MFCTWRHKSSDASSAVPECCKRWWWQIPHPAQALNTASVQTSPGSSPSPTCPIQTGLPGKCSPRGYLAGHNAINTSQICLHLKCSFAYQSLALPCHGHAYLMQNVKFRGKEDKRLNQFHAFLELLYLGSILPLVLGNPNVWGLPALLPKIWHCSIPHGTHITSSSSQFLAQDSSVQ